MIQIALGKLQEQVTARIESSPAWCGKCMYIHKIGELAGVKELNILLIIVIKKNRFSVNDPPSFSIIAPQNSWFQLYCVVNESSVQKSSVFSPHS